MADSSNRITTRKLPRLFALLALAATIATAQSTPSETFELLAKNELDAASAITVRDTNIDLEDVHLSLTDGMLIFLKPVNGHVTGALFIGNGEVLVIPPTPEERQSMALFTGAAVLNERFAVAYLRFANDAIATRLQAAARTQPDNAAEVTARFHGFVDGLAILDALPLTLDLTATPSDDTYFHARIVGQKLGGFDIVLDSRVEEQQGIVQVKHSGDRILADIWASFCFRRSRDARGGCRPREDDLRVLAYQIDATVTPPHSISATARVRVKPARPGQTLLAMDLGRELQIASATMDGRPLALVVPTTGNQRLSEAFAVVLPEPSVAGREYSITLSYSGPILADAGGGLVYVDERGRWYPTRGIDMADFDLTFHYPADWQLLATGTRTESHIADGSAHARWLSDRAMPFAGFNLGHYIGFDRQAEPGMPQISSYAARQVELALQAAPAAPPPPPPSVGWHRRPFSRFENVPLPVPNPDPSRNAAAVADQAARTIQYLQPRLGAFPYRSLHLTQFPGMVSQGFPGLVYLSSFVFLSPAERWRGRIPPDDFTPEILFSRVMAAHETAHQWWGDKVTWHSYREQWLCEALANYLSLMQLEPDDPESFAVMLDSYRTDLLGKQPDSGLHLKDAGAVTLGVRLNSSKFPNAYDPVAYGRGTWLIHMLRQMYRDSAAHPSIAVRGKGKARSKTAPPPTDPDAAFFAVLRSMQERFDGRAMSTADMKAAFEAALPPDLRFEGKRSLDWFFDEWVNGTAVPLIELRNVRFSPDRAHATFSITQKACQASLVTSVPVYAEMKDGSLRFLKRVFAEGEESDFRLATPAGVSKLVLDPYRSILRM